MTRATISRSSWIALLFLCLSTTMRAQTFSVLAEFGLANDPELPSYEGIIAQGRDGNLYSTSPSVNSSANGTMFCITPQGVLTVPYYFLDGNLAESGVTLGTDGNFYATTIQSVNDYGEIYRLTSSGTATVLHAFTDGADGGGPKGPPIQGLDGNYYGTTDSGGADGDGTIYKLTPAGVLTTIYSFTDFANGTYPWAPLVQGSDGNFYGSTFEGGTSGGGVFYKVTTSGKYTALYNFSGLGGTIGPLVQYSNGDFYGTTSQGGSGSLGTVFKITPGGKITILHDFTGSPDGAVPQAGLVLATDGNFYGVTSRGGASSNCQGGCGTIFKITPSGTLQVLYSFDLTTGYMPNVTLVQHTNGILYGDTTLGGTSSQCTQGCGVFFSMDIGLAPFVRVLLPAGVVGSQVEILGQGFTGASGVSFNGTAASFSVVSDTYMTATVPSGAKTGVVKVTTPGGVLDSSKSFVVTPQIVSFSPSSGNAGTVVTISGAGLIQAAKVKFGGVTATNFTVNSDSKVTATVPTGAKTGKVEVTTPGGTAASARSFTVIQ
jgi:uncharacterized repeat protein (TIGR03803 family)